MATLPTLRIKKGDQWVIVNTADYYKEDGKTISDKWKGWAIDGAKPAPNKEETMSVGRGLPNKEETVTKARLAIREKLLAELGSMPSAASIILRVADKTGVDLDASLSRKALESAAADAILAKKAPKKGAK